MTIAAGGVSAVKALGVVPAVLEKLGLKVLPVVYNSSGKVIVSSSNVGVVVLG